MLESPLDVDPRLYLVIAVALAVALLILPRLLRRRSAARAAPSTDWDRDRAERQLQVRDNLDQILVQIQETSREQVARLDTKIRLLQKLVDDADQRIRKLQELQGIAPSPAPPPPVPPPVPERPVPPLHREVYQLADQGLDAPAIASRMSLDRGEVDLILNLRTLKKM